MYSLLAQSILAPRFKFTYFYGQLGLMMLDDAELIVCHSEINISIDFLIMALINKVCYINVV